MNYLPGILRIILPVFIVWSLVSSCDEKVEDYIQPHVVKVITGIDITVDQAAWNDQTSDPFPNPVPEDLIFKMKVTGTYNDFSERDLEDEEIRDYIKWSDSSADGVAQVLSIDGNSGYAPGEISLKGDELETVRVVALYMPSPQNGHRSFSSKPVEFVVTKPTLINIQVSADETFVNNCPRSEKQPLKIVEGCLEQFKATGVFNNRRSVDLTESVTWSPEQPAYAQFVKNIYDASEDIVTELKDEDDNKDWPKKVKEYVESRGWENKHGLVLGKFQGELDFTVTYLKIDGGYKLDGSQDMIAGVTSVKYKITFPQIKEIRLSIPEKPESTFVEAADCLELTNCAQVGVEGEKSYSMIQNTMAQPVAIGIYENDANLPVTGAVDWSLSSESANSVSINSVSGKITAQESTPAGETITVKAEKDSTWDSVEIRVDREIMTDAGFWVDATTDKGERHKMSMGNTYYASAPVAKFYVEGIYNNDNRVVSRKIGYCRIAALNYNSPWDSTNDIQDETLFKIKKDASWDAPNCDIDVNFPVWIEVRSPVDVNEASVDAKITLTVETPDAPDNPTTHTWDVVVSSGRIPVNVQITPSIDSSDDRWVAEKLIKLEAVGVYESGLSEILFGEDKVVWSSAPPNCVIGGVERPCFTLNSTGIDVVTHEPVTIMATHGTHTSEFDIINISPISPSELKSIKPHPRNQTVKAGDSVFFTAEGIFDNERIYVLDNDCLNWSLSDSTSAEIDARGVFRGDPKITVRKEITVEAQTKGGCGESWQDIPAGIAGSVDISVDALPAVSLAGSDANVTEGGGFTVWVKTDGDATSENDIIVPCLVGGTAFQNKDYSAEPNDFNFVIEKGNISSASISFSTLTDGLDEDDQESVEISVLEDSLVNARIGSSPVVTVNINDHAADNPPLLSFMGGVSSQEVDENADLVFISFKLSEVSGRDITVDYTVSGDSSADMDHTLKSGSFIIPEGSETAVLLFNILNDKDYENEEESLVVDITTDSDTAAWSGGNIYTFTINDNDSLDISGDPPGDCDAGDGYTFKPDVNTDLPLEFRISNKPSWASFEPSDGTLSGLTDTDDTADSPYEGILICAKDAASGVEDCLPPFTIEVSLP